MRSFLSSTLLSPNSLCRECRKHAFSTKTSLRRTLPLRPQGFSQRSQRDDKGDSNAGNTGRLLTSRDQVSRTHDAFRRLLLHQYNVAMSSTRSWSNNRYEYRGFGLKSALDFDREVKLFRLSLEKACDLAARDQNISNTSNPLFWTMRKAFIEGDVPGLIRELNHAFQNFLLRSRFPKDIAATHAKLADFRYPHEWFPATRALQRTVYLHVGPTNSGKTYNALKALEEAKSGLYAGPLRLLAHEVYTRFTAKGKPCALVTGEEQRIPDADNFFISCTVEMTPVNRQVDVAVIDEIQMIGDFERGWAWTQAFLGVQAKELHVCGEERAVELIQNLCATIGDECIVRRYERLNPLETMHESLRGDFRNLQKGDAVVSFSRLAIHSLKQSIEQATGKLCAIVYGSLPPETRAQQAAYFNDPNNDYDFLVASDAIGMGLNLEIKRVIFEQSHKRTKQGFRSLTVSEVKQIGGRAGRFRTASQDIRSGALDTGDKQISVQPQDKQPGLVTAMEDDDLAFIIKAFKRDPEPLETAGLQPPSSVIERFSTYYPPNTPLSYILTRLREISQLSSRYHMCYTPEMLSIADLIQPFPMSIYDRSVFLNAPVFLRERKGSEIVQAFARCVSNMDGGDLLDIPEVNIELLDYTKETWPQGPAGYLQGLETLHKAITLYLWLSYRYSGVLRSQRLAFHVKELVETQIDISLTGANITDASRRARNQSIRKKARASQQKRQEVLGEGTFSETHTHEGPGEWNEEGHEEPLIDDPSQLEEISRLKAETLRGKPTEIIKEAA